MRPKQVVQTVTPRQPPSLLFQEFPPFYHFRLTIHKAAGATYLIHLIPSSRILNVLIFLLYRLNLSGVRHFVRSGRLVDMSPQTILPSVPPSHRHHYYKGTKQSNKLYQFIHKNTMLIFTNFNIFVATFQVGPSYIKTDTTVQ